MNKQNLTAKGHLHTNLFKITSCAFFNKPRVINTHPKMNNHKMMLSKAKLVILTLRENM